MESLTIPESIINELANCRRGIEKEGLRVSYDGVLSEMAHPKELGSALTHPSITTDYSEALLEFVTKPHASIDEAMAELSDLHRFTSQVLAQQGEMIWANSMPCLMIEDHEIPIAQYGSSNLGQMKTVYRRGLGHRYGRTMQTIAGIHYNWSLSDEFWRQLAQSKGEETQHYKNEMLMKAVRNIYRSSGIITYLLGASPAICSSFIRNGEAKGLIEISKSTLYSENGTSLRLSDIGYSNDNEQRAEICLDNIEQYASDLMTATRTPNEKYQKIGVKIDGQYRQLNANILQLENEYYAPVRPKQIARGLVRVADALSQQGIGYLELRIVDIDPFDPIGISARSCHLLEAYLLACLLRGEPEDDPLGCYYTSINRTIVENGRDPNATAVIDGTSISIRDWLKAEASLISDAATLLDQANNCTRYSDTVACLFKGFNDPTLLPSAKSMEEVKRHGSFFRLASAQSQAHQQTLLNEPLSADKTAYYRQLATQSLSEQRELEKDTSINFDQYLVEYFK